MRTPKNVKTISLRGYEVTYYDVREPKPRTENHDIIVYDEDAIRALALLGEDLYDCIKDRFMKGGFHVISIKKARCTSVCVDLQEAYKKAIEADTEDEYGFEPADEERIAKQNENFNQFAAMLKQHRQMTRINTVGDIFRMAGYSREQQERRNLN